MTSDGVEVVYVNLPFQKEGEDLTQGKMGYATVKLQTPQDGSADFFYYYSIWGGKSVYDTDGGFQNAKKFQVALGNNFQPRRFSLVGAVGKKPEDCGTDYYQCAAKLAGTNYSDRVCGPE